MSTRLHIEDTEHFTIVVSCSPATHFKSLADGRVKSAPISLPTEFDQANEEFQLFRLLCKKVTGVNSGVKHYYTVHYDWKENISSKALS